MLPSKKYKIILADPPWEDVIWSNNGKNSKHTSSKYDLMTIEQIMSMGVADIADKDCALFLWTTKAHTAQAIKVMEAWGFEYKDQLIWDKRTKHGKRHFGMGRVTRGAHEIILIGTKGEPRVHGHGVRSIQEGLVREHSRKPDWQYTVPVELYGDFPRIELFSRQGYPGWDVWGNQTGMFKIEKETKNV